MQLRSLIFTAAIVTSTVLTPTASAGKCTDSQLKNIEQLDDEAAFHKACPRSDDGSFDMDSTDPKVWAKASPCNDPGCAAFLKQQASKVPDCDVDDINMKKHYQDQLDLCVDLASGKLSSDEIKARIANATDDWTSSFDGSYGEWSGSFDDWFDEEETKKQEVMTTKSSESNATVTTNATNTPNTPNTTTPAKTPTPKTKKSSATVLVISAGVVAISAVMASLTVA